MREKVTSGAVGSGQGSLGAAVAKAPEKWLVQVTGLHKVFHSGNCLDLVRHRGQLER